MVKASAECEEFISKKTLHSIGLKDTDGIWKARHRLYATAHAHPILNITADPFLIEARSPLAWSIALFMHNKIAPAPFLDRPSTASHKPWKDCHRLSLKFHPGIPVDLQEDRELLHGLHQEKSKSMQSCRRPPTHLSTDRSQERCRFNI